MRRHLLSLLAVPLAFGSLAVPLHAAAAPATLGASFKVQTPAGRITPGTPTPQAYGGPAAGDLFGDGRQEVVAGFPDGSVRAWDAAGNPLPGWPRQTGAAVHSTPTLADLNGDGRNEVIVSSEDGYIYVWNGDGSTAPGWPRHLLMGGPWSSTGFQNGFFSGVAVGDVFGDGRRELVASAWDHHLYMWNTTGDLFPGFPINLWDTTWTTPLLVDLEHRGQLDIVVGSDSSGGSSEPYPAGGVEWAFRPTGCPTVNGATGCQVWGWPKLLNQVPWSSPAGTDLGRNGIHEVLTGTGYFYPKPAGQYVAAWRQDGAGMWTAPTSGRTFGSPAVGDLLGTGGRQVVEITESGLIYAWDGNGNALPGWPVDTRWPGLASSAVIAPVDNSGHNGVWACVGNILEGWSSTGTMVVQQVMDGDCSGAPTVADLGNGRLDLLVLVQADRAAPNPGSTHQWEVYDFAAPGPARLPSGSWPTFHGSMSHSGYEVPTAHVNALNATQNAASFPVSWAVDAGSEPASRYAVWVRDGQGPWQRWQTGTAATSDTFIGLAGHTYAFQAQATSAAGTSEETPSSAVTTSVAAGAPAASRGVYAVAPDGQLHWGSSAPLAPSATWPGSNITRGIAVTAGGRGGYVLDLYGGLHAFGTAPAAQASAYWPYWDIARAVAVAPNGFGYTLDGYGGVHPFGGAPAVNLTGYWPGWDIARGIVVRADGRSGYVLNGWGGVWPFGAPGDMPPYLATSATWNNWDIARGITLQNDRGGWVVDGYGGVHPFGGAPAVNPTGYWPGWDIARGLAASPGGGAGGWTVDGYGGFHPFGNAPPLTAPQYQPGRDVVRGVAAG